MDRIIAEMKRRLDGYREEMKKGDSITGCMTLAGRCAALEEMIEYIETLQKESASDGKMDNLQKIKTVVEVLKNSGCASPISVCNDLLSFIESLQQPASDDIAMRMKVMEERDRLSSAITSEKENAHDVDLMEVRESVPKELNNRILEEAINHSERWKDFRGADAMKVSYSEFAFGAQWMYEQMMKESIDVAVIDWYKRPALALDRIRTAENLNLKVCDRVKIVIIKMDKQ